ncbi:unnamed protein product [Chrysoparadoxa australica]
MRLLGAAAILLGRASAAHDSMLEQLSPGEIQPTVCLVLCNPDGPVSHALHLPLSMMEDCPQNCSNAVMSLAKAKEQGMGQCVGDMMSLGRTNVLELEEAAFASGNLLEAAGVVYSAYKKLSSGNRDDALAMVLEGATDAGSPEMCKQLPGMHYCTVTTQKFRPLTPLVGLCVPEECTMHQLVSLTSSLMGDGQELERDMIHVQCHEKAYQIESAEVLTIVLLVVLALLVLAGSYMEAGNAGSMPQGEKGIEGRVASSPRKSRKEERKSRRDRRRSDVASPPAEFAGAPAHAVEEGEAEGSESGQAGKAEAEAERAADVSVGDTGIGGDDWEHVTTLRDQRPCYERALLCFGARRNWDALFNMDGLSRSGGGEYAVLDGIRVLSVAWLIMGQVNVALLTEEPGLSNTGWYLNSFMKRWSALAVINFDMCVESFFVLGGFLCAITGLRKLERHGSWKSVPMLYLLRYLRMAPSLLVILCVQTFLLPLWGSGIHWNYDFPKEVCANVGWQNLFLASNLGPYQGRYVCVEQSWYLAMDMQLYVVACLMLLLYISRRKPAVWLLSALAVLSCLSAVIYTGRNHIHYTWLDSALDVALEDKDLHKNWFYNTWFRCPSYIAGMLTAVVWLDYFRGREISQMVNAAMTFGWVTLLYFGLYGPYWAYQEVPSSAGRWAQAWYIGLGRFAWSMGLCILLLQCLAQKAYIIQGWLSWKVWEPLAKLSFGAFLTHTIFISWYFNLMPQQEHFNGIFLAVMYTGFGLAAFSTSVPLYLMLEAPIKRLSQEFLLQQAKVVS